MPDITTMCIVLYNLCIVNYKDIEEGWITEAENKLATRITERDFWERRELQGKNGSYRSEKKIGHGGCFDSGRSILCENKVFFTERKW
jgi:hypothetical protein